MEELRLSNDIALEKLPNGDYVGYSPAGSAKPFLLTGKALSVIEFFLETPVLDLPTLKTIALSKGVSDEVYQAYWTSSPMRESSPGGKFLLR